MRKILILFAFILGFESLKASDTGEQFDISEYALHHIADSHSFNVIGNLDINLPVIIYAKGGFYFFNSSKFNNDDKGEVLVKNLFVKYKDKIYYADKTLSKGFIKFGKDNTILNQRPLDLSITKNVCSMWLSIMVLSLIFVGSARFYKSDKYEGLPKGIARFVEPLIIFVIEDIAKPNIGLKYYRKYTPYLLTVFFFIWVNNIFGLIPFFPFGVNLSGNIAFTMSLAVFTFLITQFISNRTYWKHIFWTPGVPVPIKIFLIPIELIGLFTKPFSLMIRLFANITSGHILIISLISLTFIFKSYFVGVGSVVSVVFISIIEIIVTAIQAYIFTSLTSLYFGIALSEEHK